MNFIELKDASKRYKNDLILHQVNYRFEQNKSYAITGPNGSGKSTLLKICAAYLQLTTGEVLYTVDDRKIAATDVYRHLTMATPYMELPEEFTPLEILDFHLRFKSFIGGMSKQEFLQRVYLDTAADKALHYFSSGMKQRFKIGLAMLTESKILLLDEPLINLDARGINLYHTLAESCLKDRITIICSNNVEEEISFCEHSLDIMDYKQ